LLGDGVWAALALAGVAALAQHESVVATLGLVGALFISRLAFTAIREAWRGSMVRPSVRSARGDLGIGIVFGIANPAGLAFWAGVGGGTLATRGSDAEIPTFAAFLLAHLAGALCWSLGLSALVGWGRRFARPRVFRAIDAVCGAVLGVFGVRLLWTTVRKIGV